MSSLLRYPLKPQGSIGAFLIYFAKKLNAEPKHCRPSRPKYCLIVRFEYLGRTILHAIPDEDTFRWITHSSGMAKKVYYELSLRHLRPLSPTAADICKRRDEELLPV